MRLSRRTILGGVAAAATPVLDRIGLPIAAPAIAQSVEWRPAVSVFGEIKYPAAFKNFDYVNARAPKGGVVRLAAYGTFDNFNVTVSGVKGRLVNGIGLIYDSLLAESLDEVHTAYGELAEALKY